jgi:hypothetical protein
MIQWMITIEIWPYFTGKGQKIDQEAAGERIRYFYTDADDFREASKLARCFQEGVQANPAVWRAPITGVVVHRNG